MHLNISPVKITDKTEALVDTVSLCCALLDAFRASVLSEPQSVTKMGDNPEQFFLLLFYVCVVHTCCTCYL